MPVLRLHGSQTGDNSEEDGSVHPMSINGFINTENSAESLFQKKRQFLVIFRLCSYAITECSFYIACQPEIGTQFTIPKLPCAISRMRKVIKSVEHIYQTKHRLCYKQHKELQPAVPLKSVCQHASFPDSPPIELWSLERVTYMTLCASDACMYRCI